MCVSGSEVQTPETLCFSTIQISQSLHLSFLTSAFLELNRCFQALSLCFFVGTFCGFIYYTFIFLAKQGLLNLLFIPRHLIALIKWVTANMRVCQMICNDLQEKKRGEWVDSVIIAPALSGRDSSIWKRCWKVQNKHLIQKSNPIATQLWWNPASFATVYKFRWAEDRFFLLKVKCMEINASHAVPRMNRPLPWAPFAVSPIALPDSMFSMN